jgi:hypothetical protein
VFSPPVPIVQRPRTWPFQGVTAYGRNRPPIAQLRERATIARADVIHALTRKVTHSLRRQITKGITRPLWTAEKAPSSRRDSASSDRPHRGRRTPSEATSVLRGRAARPARASRPLRIESDAQNRGLLGRSGVHVRKASELRSPGNLTVFQGWTCEAHPDQPWRHDALSGRGKKCGNPESPRWQGLSPAAFEHRRLERRGQSSRSPNRAEAITLIRSQQLSFSSTFGRQLHYPVVPKRSNAFARPRVR